MKRKNISLGIISVMAITLLTGCGKEIEVKNGSKVAVSVSGDKFTATEYYERIKENNISVLIDMIDHSLFDEKYKTDDKETEEINNQINQIKNYYGSDESTFKNILQQYFGVDSEEELREKLSLEYKRNEAVKDHVKENLTDDEIKKYYDENIYGEAKASHILISVEAKEDASQEEKDEADKKAKEKAEKIIKQLNDGKKFEDLAKKNSKDEATASNGGDLGYFDIDKMATEFADAVKKLEIGEYTKEPIKTEYGYHIILKTDQKEKPKLKKVKDDIKDKLTTNKLNDDNTLYYNSLIKIRENNKIKWNDDVLKNSYNDYMNDLIEKASK